MRPVRLEIQGLTAFKERQEIDFAGLDLFAITGPTGAGKTTLVDAITYALFGEVPRVGDSIRQMISQGAERMSVEFEFTSEGARYRVHRATGHRGVPTTRVDRYDAASEEWVPEADRAREVTDYVTNLLGMDYDGFVRAILLPQGQFEKFLAGRPEERRKVLDGLLRLDRYQRMMQRANEIASTHDMKAASLQQALDQYAGATPDALEATRALLADHQGHARALGEAKRALAEALRTAEALSAALEQGRRAKESLTAAEKDLVAANDVLQSGQKAVDGLAAQIVVLEKELEANTYDSELHNRLTDARTAAQESERAAKKLTETEALAKDAQPRVKQAEARAAAAQTAITTARNNVETATGRVDTAKRENVAVGLRRGLKPGDPCPVCGQKITSLAAETHDVLDEAEKALSEARRAYESVQKAAQDADRELDRAQQGVQTIERQLEVARDEASIRAEALRALLSGQAIAVEKIAAAIQQQDAARRERMRLTDDIKNVSRERDQKAAAIQSAGQRVAALKQQADTAHQQAESTAQDAATAVATLKQVATANPWPEVATEIAAGRSPKAQLSTRHQHAETEDRQVHQQIGAAETDIKRIEEGMAKAKGIAEEAEAARTAGLLAKNLAALLRVTAFPNYIREQALKVLAQDGSRQLLEISSGRYEFEVDGQEFMVSDRWNGNESRSVKTLSGGETFLASLALALALAERLPSLGAGGQGGALESLFIDEGFSHLDLETLDTVASALEVIGQGGERMVGVVTHVTALAERMPARIVVHKSQSGSTVTVE
jgi:exonuclease SbcC